VLSVLTFWLFAQSVINVVPAMKSSLDISLETLTLAVSLSALFSGCFVVASGGLADKFGRMRMTHIGLGLSIAGAADPGPGGAVSRRARFTGAVGGLHHARDPGIDQNLV
jgi:MFS family permease